MISVPITDNENLKNYADLNIIIFKKLDVKRVETNLKFGIKDNPFLSTMVVGSYTLFMTKVFQILKFLKERAKVVVNQECFFQNNVVTLNFKCSVSLSIIDYFWGILESKITRLKMGEKLKWQKI